MIKQIITITVLSAQLGCAGLQNKIETPPAEEQVPADYIIEPEITIDQALDPIKEQKPDYVVSFGRGTPKMLAAEQSKLNNWLKTVGRDNRIIVHGAAGPIKYKSIGEARAAAVLQYLQSKNYVVVLMPYDEELPGMRAQLWALNTDSKPSIIKSLLALTVFP